MIDNAWQASSHSCHTHAVKRAIKIVSDASTQVNGETKRDGFIRQRIRSKKPMPKVNTKRDLQVIIF